MIIYEYFELYRATTNEPLMNHLICKTFCFGRKDKTIKDDQTSARPLASFFFFSRDSWGGLLEGPPGGQPWKSVFNKGSTTCSNLSRT